MQVYNIVGYAKHKIIVKVHFRNIKRRGWGVGVKKTEKKEKARKKPLKVRICCNCCN